MKKEKQISLQKILLNYEINAENGTVNYINGIQLKWQSLPSGYLQRRLDNGKRGIEGVRSVYYLHQVIWFSANGFFDEKATIAFKDGNKSNCRIDNLELSTKRKKINNVSDKIRPIRRTELGKIREAIDKGMGISDMARCLNLARSSVSATVGKINRGEVLRFEGVLTMKEKHGKIVHQR